ncbi:MAG: hypothetical protein QNL04_10115, partial [SAR324 cluster bacterium]|nr:hypothetical protein [SAR324 cluster bacterium]
MFLSKKAQENLGVKFTIYILLFSGFLAIFNTGIQLFAEYKVETGHIDSNLTQIKKVQIPALRQQIWHMDVVQLKTQLENFTKIDGINYISIVLFPSQVEVTAGKNSERYTQREQIPIFYTYQGVTQKIADMEVISSYDQIYANLINMVALILVTQFLKTSLVSMFIIYLFYTLVGKP